MNDALSVSLSIVLVQTVLQVVWVRSGIVRVTAKVVARSHGSFAKWVELYFPPHSSNLASRSESNLAQRNTSCQFRFSLPWICKQPISG